MNKTKCPYCKIGFPIVCTGEKEFIHLDIMWNNEAGLQIECRDAEAIIPHIVENLEMGTKFSLNEEMLKEMKDRNDKFHENPSGFNKNNTEWGDFITLIGEFFRYSEYMMERELKNEEMTNSELKELYNKGMDIKEIIDEITKEINTIIIN